MTIEFRLPELGENIGDAEVAEILVREGDQIEAEQMVMELETEKAVLELPCPHAGRVEKVHVSEGDTIAVGSVILTIDESATVAATADTTSADSSAAPKAESVAVQATAEKEAQKSEPPTTAPIASQTTVETKEQPAHTQQPPQDDSPPPPAGPSTRRMARKLGVNLHLVSGSGSGGRILPEDVEAYVKNQLTSPGRTTSESSAPALPDFTKFGTVERKPLGKLNRTAAEQLSTSWRVIPHVTQHELTNITVLESVRKRYMQTTGKDGPKITMTAIVLKACVQLLTEMPRINSSLDTVSNELILKQYYHIGVAVDTEHGLVVPVIKDADQKSILEIAEELTQLADKARRRKLELADMQGATFTITNLGGIGGTSFTPIVNHPEVAILGLSRAQPQPVLIEGELQEQLMMPLSFSYDHRVINGADAARFVVRLSSLLAQPFGLLANV